MSVTTTNELTRGQAAQMPALLEFHSPSAGLLDTPVKGPARAVIWIILALVIACVTPAALIPIDKVVSATGRLSAMHTTVVVQPLETSIVREIDVQEGDVVHKGQLLARLDPTFSQSDKVSARDQAAIYQAQIARMQAEIAGKQYDPASATPADLVQETIYAQRRAEYLAHREDYQRKIASLQAQLSKSLGDIQGYTERMRVAKTVQDKRQELQTLGWGSQLNTLSAQDQSMEMARNLADSQNQAKSAANDLASMKAQDAADQQDWKTQTIKDLTDAQGKLADIQGSLDKADLRSKLVDLRADVDATVQTRAPVSVGSVLQSGDQFFTLVPLNSPLEVEATIPGEDAAYVVIGDPVTVKLSAFPFERYGALYGKVRAITPDSFTSNPDGPAHKPDLDVSSKPVQPGEAFYRAWITIDRNTLHATPEGFRLTPGMPLSADIKVGTRTVLGYIFSRVIPTASEGMREP